MKRQFKAKKLIALILAMVMSINGVPMSAKEVKAAETSSFALDFTQNISELNGVYLTQNSCGTGWKVHSLQEGSSNKVVAGQYVELGIIDNSDVASAFAFTAPETATYDITIDFEETNGTCDAEVYVNDVYAGTIKTSKTETGDRGYVLSDIHLNAGEYGNTIKLVTKASTASGWNGKYYIRLKTINFTASSTQEPTPAPTEAPTLAPTTTPSSIPTEAPTQAPGGSSTEFTLDFGIPTQGLSGSDVTATGGMNPIGESAALTYSVNTSLAGTNWVLNSNKTTINKDSASTYTYDAKRGVLYHKAKASNESVNFDGSRITVRLGCNQTMAFDFHVPTSGLYEMQVIYIANTQNGSVTVNPDTVYESVFDNIIPAGTANAEALAETKTVPLTEGTNTITFLGTGSTNYVSFRAVSFKRVGEMPAVPTPAPTLAPTPLPTLAPTATPMPTEDPNAVKEPFQIHISTLDMSTAYTTDNTYLYFTNSTVGSNWAVHSSDETIMDTGYSSARIYVKDEVPYRVVLYRLNQANVLSFTAPAAGYYDMSAIMTFHEEGGYADVFVNDEYVGTVDSSKTIGIDDQKLKGVYLKGGELANKIAIVPTGASNGSGIKTYWAGFNFTVPETVATLTGIEIIAETETMYVGDTQIINGTGSLTNGGLYRFSSLGYTVSYTSSDPTVATVTSDGKVTALKEGTTTITAMVPELGYSDSVEINVYEVAYTIPELNLVPNQAFGEGDTFTLKARARFNRGEYADPSKVSVAYASTNETVAKVENGVLYALVPGTATIKADITYEGKTLQASYDIVVEPYAPPVAFVVNFMELKNTIVSGDYSYISKDTYGTNWKVSPETTMNLAVSEAIPGQARIFKGSKDYVTFYNADASFVFDVNVKNSGEYDITADMIRHESGGKAAVYVNDKYVGTIDTYSKVTDTSTIDKQPLLGTKLNKGSNKIRVQILGPSSGTGFYTKLAGFTFTVPSEMAKITSIDAKADVDNMYVGRKEQISVETTLSNGGFYEAEHATEPYTYESSNPQVATVSGTGLITGVGAGETTITVTSTGSGYSDMITFDVSDAAYEKVELNVMEDETIYITNERTLEVVATLADGTIISHDDLEVTYTSSNPSVAKIENGVLKALAKGDAAITATAKFKIDGTTKTDVKNIVVTTIPLKGVTGVTVKPVVQELDTAGIPFVVQGVAEDDTIVEDLVVAGFENFDYKYESLTPDIISIDTNGVCHYVSRGVGKVKIMATIDGVSLEGEAEVVSSSGKRGRTIYTDEMVANAKYNVKNYKWGVSRLKSIGGKSYPYVYSFEDIYNMIPHEGIPRSYENSTRDVSNEIKFCCPNCGISVEEVFGGEWAHNPLEYPWKIWCPNCGTNYPTNDFGLLYERGLDENGVYNRELAYQRNAEAVARGEKDALVNELYPEKGPTWMVDDGFGWSPSSGTYGTKDLYQYAPVARYVDYLWRYVISGFRSMVEYYVYTDDERYAIAGCILLDKVADVYPDYDVTKVSLNYYQSHGSKFSGKILGSIAEEDTCEHLLRAYDAFYEAFDNPKVIEFLSAKAAEQGLANPKTNGNLIRENVENGLVREVFKGLYSADISGNFGYHQTTAALAAVALDTQPETNELLVWLGSPNVFSSEKIVDPVFGKTYESICGATGGEMWTKYVNEIDRDGFGAEVSIAYNSVWTKGIQIAEILSNYGTDIIDLYKDPKFVNMFETFIHMTMGDGYSLQLGDGGSPSSGDLSDGFCDELISGYKITKDPRLAQLYNFYCGGNFNNDKMGYFNNVKELTLAVQEDVAKHGEFEFESLNLTGYGLAVVRGGKAATRHDQYETRYDTWMYYGRSKGSHAHFDVLSLGIDAFGFNFMPDLAAPAFKGKSAERNEWINQTISHNLVTVDETRQIGIYTGQPLHFDVTDNVKLIDTESSASYDQTDIYRRTAVTIAANEDVAYTLDFFRVKGGNKHTYSFHSQSYEAFFTDDIVLTPQTNEKGEYVGTYAGPDVPYGPDPNSTDSVTADETMYPRGYTWLDRVKRGVDKTNDGLFTVKFEQSNWKHQVVDAAGLAMKVHAVNDWTPDSVDFATGHPCAKLENEMIPGYDYMLIQRSGENLDTLFTTVLEPYKIHEYINKAEGIEATIKAGAEDEDDVVKVVKVTLHNGRTDYVIYATNKNVVYNVTDGNVNFDFAGFVGVYSVDYFGNNIYSYVNDGTIIGNVTGIGAYTGTVVDFTKEYVMDDYIIIKTDQPVEDPSVFADKYIYIDNKGAKCNGAYRILSAEMKGDNIELYLGNCSLIDRYEDDYNLDAGFVYTIAEGQSFYIPMTATQGEAFTGSNRPATAPGGSSASGASSDAGSNAVVDAETSEDSLKAVEEEMLYGDEELLTQYDNVVDDEPIADDKSYDNSDVKGETSSTETQGSTETANGEPTATPEAVDANADGNRVRNILLGGLGVLALGAGIFLILLGKKKKEESE